jgi:hypothetical protein
MVSSNDKTKFLSVIGMGIDGSIIQKLFFEVESVTRAFFGNHLLAPNFTRISLTMNSD